MEDSDHVNRTGMDDETDERIDCDATAEKVIAIVAEVLDRPRSDFGLHTRAVDIEGWDSFGHVRIILAIDKAFEIRLSMQAIEQAEGIAGLVAAVESARRAA